MVFAVPPYSLIQYASKIELLSTINSFLFFLTTQYLSFKNIFKKLSIIKCYTFHKDSISNNTFFPEKTQKISTKDSKLIFEKTQTQNPVKTQN